MKYSELVTKISRHIDGNSDLIISNPEELKASYTHWIMNRFTPVPYWTSNYEKIFSKLLIEMELDKKNDALLSSNKRKSISVKYDIPFPPPRVSSFKFIDLFAGVGGIRLGFQKSGGECVFSSEWNEAAQKTYSLNYGEYPYGDITKVQVDTIPSHDILLAGFPCQAFSIAGYRQGFDDIKGRGNLFFKIDEILRIKQPKAFLLENVKNLKSHDKGNTFRVIEEYLKRAGYSVISNVLNTMEYGNIPQNRERIYIVGFKDEADWESRPSNETCSSRFKWPKKKELKKSVQDLLETGVDEQFYYDRYDCYKQLKHVVTSRDTVYQWRRVYVRENKKGVCPTLTANMGTGGHNVPLVLDAKDIRKLTPRECFRLQGFPDNYKLPKDMANSHLYKQAGNSVSVAVVERIAKAMIKAMNI